MAIDSNWTSYDVEIGWKEVPPSEVFSSSVLMKLLEESITLTYQNGKLEFHIG